MIIYNYSYSFECCSAGAFGPEHTLIEATERLKYYHKQHVELKKCNKKPLKMFVRHTKTGQIMDINMIDPDYDDMTPDFTERIDEVI